MWLVIIFANTMHSMSAFTSLTDRHPFNGLFFRTTWLSRHQKGKTNLDFNEATNDGG